MTSPHFARALAAERQQRLIAEAESFRRGREARPLDWRSRRPAEPRRRQFAWSRWLIGLRRSSAEWRYESRL